MLEQIDNWLKDVKRKYAFGLAIFMALASIEVKKKYGDFFKEGDTEDVEPNDPRFPMLINKVTAIYNIVRANPDKYAEALSKIGAPIIRTNDQVKQIIALNEERETLQAKISELEDLDEDKAAEIDNLQEEIEDKDKTIDELKEQLKTQGVKVMEGKDLPKTIKSKYDRVKDIVPLMAAIHAELKDTSITDEQRKAKAAELCRLDDERRTLWDDIDAYLNEYNSVLTEENKFRYSEDPVIRGTQIANRMVRLKENIRRNQEAAERHKASNKPNLEQKALEKVSQMQVELDELTVMINETK
ncbi:hypothetical protein JGH11_04515 [Dysgonomonas sp. Marseille-P4677]|uniref:hypothetical protein n=1 Tax=Dysgonomonas sp. Marseille-P4677 TaxID=2364790 RepID=UPI001911C823|nr:hypothetical protein [Dysgonomonas sp. Marseille-P4677]MBK5720130.1 hypothetical protein [Dysgonomonas sp. Marseille-P4677]